MDIRPAEKGPSSPALVLLMVRERKAVDMEMIQKSIDINGSVDRVFAYLDDPATGTQWLPSMMEVRNISGSGVGPASRMDIQDGGVRSRRRDDHDRACPE